MHLTPKYLLKSLLILLSIFFAFPVLAQESKPTSNYAGVSVITLNPAELADNRMKININLGSVYVDYQNNFSRWVAPHSFAKAAINPTKYPGDYKILEQKTNKNTSLNAQVLGPSVMFTIPSLNLGFAAGVKQSIFTDLQDATNVTGTFLYKGLYYRPLHSTIHQDEAFKFNLGTYNEFFFSAAYVLKEETNSAIKVGATLKKLSSNLTFNITADNLDYRVEQTTAVVNPIKSDVFFTQSQGSFINASNDFNVSAGWFLQQFTAVNGIGNGYGADIGFTYEYRPDGHKFRKKYKRRMISDPKVNKYQWKFGVGLQDLGFLRYNDPRIQIANVDEGTNQFIFGDFTGINTTDEFVSVLEAEYGLNTANYTNSFNVLMPAAIVTHADFSLGNDFYVAAVWRQSLLSRNRIGPHRSSYILVAPRFERKWFEVIIPIAISNYYNNVNFGITGRVGPLFLGLTDLTLNSSVFNSRGIAGEIGLSIPLFHSDPKSPLKCYTELKSRKKLFGRKKK